MSAVTPDVVLPLLRGRFGRPYLYEPVCASTQDLLRGSSLPEGAVAVADHQTAGRGRSGRQWEDSSGQSLLMSILLRPDPARPVAQLSLVTGLAVAVAIDRVAAVSARVKWPNDVLLDGRKVAGVLLEGDGEAVVCGVGINVGQGRSELPTGVRTETTSLRVVGDRQFERGLILAELLVALEDLYRDWLDVGLEALLPALHERDALRGQRVRVGGVAGRANGIAPDGRLIVDSDGTEVLVESGEVEKLADD